MDPASPACPRSKSTPPGVLCPDPNTLWFPSSSPLMPQHAIPESLTFPQLRFTPVSQAPKSTSGQISPLSPRHIPSCLLQCLPGDPQPAQQQLIIQPSYTQILSQTRSFIHFPQTQSVSGHLGNRASGSLPRALGPLAKPPPTLPQSLSRFAVFKTLTHVSYFLK